MKIEKLVLAYQPAEVVRRSPIRDMLNQALVVCVFLSIAYGQAHASGYQSNIIWTQLQNHDSAYSTDSMDLCIQAAEGLNPAWAMDVRLHVNINQERAGDNWSTWYRCNMIYTYIQDANPANWYPVNLFVNAMYQSCGPGTLLSYPYGVCPTAPDKAPETCGAMVGNPINGARGNKRQSELDYVAPDGLTFERFYDSSVSQRLVGMTGASWSNTFEGRLTFVGSGEGAVILVHRPNMQVLQFKQINGGWVPDADIGDTLIETSAADGYLGMKFVTATDDAEIYDFEGRLLKITSRAGHAVTLSYGNFVRPTNNLAQEKRLMRVTSSAGRQFDFTYADGSSTLGTMTDPNGGVYRYAHDPQTNNLVSVTYPDGATRNYLYNEPLYTSGTNLPNALTGIVDENGARYATWVYDVNGRAVSSEHGSGGIDRTTLDYTLSAPRAQYPGTTTVTDALGTSQTYTFSTIQGVNKFTGQSQPSGTGCGPAAASMTYDANGLVKTHTDFNGTTTRYDYEGTRNLQITRVEAQGRPEERTITTTWHPTFRLPATITEPGRVAEFVYDPTTGNLLSKTIRDTATNKTRIWAYGYTIIADNTLPNQLKTVNGPRTDVSDVTSYEYYTNGDLRKLTNALGHATEITSYDANGRATGITDPNGIVTTVTYFPRGWLHTSNVAGEITTYEYDGVGQVTRITSPSGVVVRFVYDAAHRLTDIYDAQENHIHYTLDNMGNRVTEEVFNSASQLITTKRREFDALNRLWHDIGALNQTTTYAYDAVGNLTSVDGPLASNTDETKFEYDALNRRTTAIDALLGVTRFSFDALDQLTRVTDPRNLVTQYTVNALGDVTKLESQDTAVTDKTYDEAGNVKTSTNTRGIVATYTYDALNRVTRISYSSNGGTIDFTYDVGLHALGKLTGMTDSSGTTQWTYNSKGRVASRVQTVSGQSGNLTTQYGYDNGGNLALITYPSGKVLTYGYRDGRIDSILLDNAPIMTSVAYQPFGPVKGWTWGNGVQYNRLFDSDGRIYSYPFGDSARVLGYDDASRIRSATDSASAQTFGYDALDRLTDWVAPYNQQTYGYDATGNRTLLGTGSNQYGYTVDTASNRLLNVAGPTSRNYIYDEVGNINYDGSRTFGFDSRNNISSSYTTDGTTTYQLNGWNQRVRKSGPTVKTGATVFAYDEQGHLIGEYDSTGKMIEETIYIGDLPVAVSR